MCKDEGKNCIGGEIGAYVQRRYSCRKAPDKMMAQMDWGFQEAQM